jgi:hypothetical protein
MLLGGLPNHQTNPKKPITMSKKRHTKVAQIKAIREHESGRSRKSQGVRPHPHLCAPKFGSFALL